MRALDWIVTVTVAWAASASPALAQSYRAVEIGVIDGQSHYISAKAMNAAGDIVGWIGDVTPRVAKRPLRAFLYRNGVTTIIDTPETKDCKSIDIDAEGTVTLQCDQFYHGPTYQYAGGKLTKLDRVGDRTPFELLAWKQGNAIGSGVKKGTGYYDKFIGYGSKLQPWPAVDEHVAEALAINAMGSVVFKDGDFRTGRAFVLPRGGKLTRIPSPEGVEVRVVPTAIHDNGTILGYLKNFSGGIEHAFVSVNGTTTDIDPGGAWSEAYATNTAKDVVGSKAWPNRDCKGAFLYRNGKMIDLATVTTGLSAATSCLESAVGIGDDGAIATNGKRATGGGVSFILIPVK